MEGIADATMDHCLDQCDLRDHQRCCLALARTVELKLFRALVDCATAHSYAGGRRFWHLCALRNVADHRGTGCRDAVRQAPSRKRKLTSNAQPPRLAGGARFDRIESARSRAD